MKYKDYLGYFFIKNLTKEISLLEILRLENPTDENILKTIIILEKCLDDLMEEREMIK